MTASMQTELRTELRIVYRSSDQSPLGQIADAAFVYNSRGTPSYRVLGRYALVFLLHGQGFYADALHKPMTVGRGDLFFLFPDITHRYGPIRNSQWHEFYILFNGPVFDLWRTRGVLTPDRPLYRLGATEPWLSRLTQVVDIPRGGDPMLRQIVMVGRLQSVLSDIVAAQPVSVESNAQLWLTESCDFLESELAVPVDYHWLAAKVGLSYDHFRKKFTKETGMTPQQYRTARRVQAAQKMLQETEMSVKEIAAATGYYDEFAFSNRFKQVIGVSPRAFRRGLLPEPPAPDSR